MKIMIEMKAKDVIKRNIMNKITETPGWWENIFLWKGGSWKGGGGMSMLTVTIAWSELPKGQKTDVQISDFEERN